MKVARSVIISTALLSVSLALSSLTALAQTDGVRGRVTQAADTRNLVTLRGNVHPLARPEFDQGVAPDDLPMRRMLLVLQRGPDQEAALRQLLDDQQVKSSAQFHQWLTPEQFGQQFGPADSDVQAVADWLTSQGFEVTKIAAGRTVIEFSGTAGSVRQALGTEIHRFRVNGEDHWANTSDPQIPAALAPVVAGFASLNNFPRRPASRNLGTFSRSKATGQVQPLFTFPAGCPSGSGACYYYAVGPQDFATIYNVTPLWTAEIDGTGQNIAVSGESNINPQDVADFRSMFGLPANPPNIILNGMDPGITSSDESEADLDVEWSGAIAKGATIDLVVSESTEATAGIDLSALYIVDNNLAPVMSESYGTCEAYLGAAGNQFYSTLWEQAAAQGITVLISAGDTGSAGCDYYTDVAAQYGLGVSGIASTPFNVAVGGTDFNVTASTASNYWASYNSTSQSSAKSYIPEITWNDSCADAGSLTGCTSPPSTTDLNDGYDLTAGSGGPSSCTNPTGTFPNVTCSGKYSKPSWQSGQGVPTDGARDIPDLSLFAGDGFHYSFYVMCQMDASAYGSTTSCNLSAPYENFEGGAGTSAAAQVFAGVMAMVNQRYGRQGNANYVLYPMAANAVGNGTYCTSGSAPLTNSNCIFYDVTAGNNSVICAGGSPNCSSTASGEYGIVVSGNSAAYPATAGYDLATGWGSVNVANLVNNWTSSFAPSATKLALATNPATNPIALTHGQPINFTVTVTSGGGTPTGDVSLIAQAGSGSNGATGIGPFPLNGGSVADSTVMLPAGSYNVTAHYAGNGILAASDSSPGIPVTVGKEGSQTEIRLVTFNLATGQPSYVSTPTSVAYGSSYVLRMDVLHGSDGNPCASATTGLISYPCPTGGLTVSPAPTDVNPPAGTVAGSYTLNSQGYAEDQPIQQPPGQYNFVASYAGDNSYTASTSSTLPITITHAPTTLTLTVQPSSIVLGVGTFQGTATLNTQSNGTAPTGTIQLFYGSNPWTGPMQITGTPYSPSTGAFASAGASVNEGLPAGISTVTAQYSGDSNYAAATSNAITLTVGDYSLSVNPSPVIVSAPGQTGNSTLSVTPQYGFTGTVLLTIVGCPLGSTCTLSPTSVTVNSAAPTTSTLTVTTTAASSAPPVLPRKAPPSFRLPIGLLWLLAGSLALAVLLSSSATRRRPATLLFATTLVVAGVWAACGGSGGGGGGGTPTPAPAVNLSSATLTFGSQNTGGSSAAQSVTLTNIGTATLSSISISMAGANPGDFSQTNTCGSSVAAGANCTINVTFTPTIAGSRSASLSIADNANGSPQTVGLTGTGVAAPIVGLSSATLTFGQQVMNTMGAAQTETISNTGLATLIFSAFSITGPDSADFGFTTNICGNIAPQANCGVGVRFIPLATGPRSASLSLVDNASGSPQTVDLTGTGVLPPTPPGNYTVLVQALIGQNEHSLTIPVTVQ
jgi:hypothetical protein